MKIYNPQKNITVVEIPMSEIDKIDFATCKQPRQTLKAFYDGCEIKPDIICNGGFFNMATGESVFNYIDNKKVEHEDAAYRWGVGLINGKLKFGCIDQLNFDDFISAYPSLIELGQPINITWAKELDYKARRTILGYNDNTLFIVAVDSPGMNFKQMQDFMMSLNVTFAINLDGGGSTKILEKGNSITSTLYNRAVDNVVAVYLKKTIHRVQAGAFSKWENAEKLMNQIKNLDDTIGAGYKNAYIRKINGLFKVQIGAFSKKENAMKVVKDLKDKGINCFITTE